MKRTHSSIFFDLDGTISDSYPGIKNGIIFALEKLGIENVERHDIERMIGIPLKDSLGQFYFGEDKEKIELAIKHFKAYYNSNGVYESEIYSGIRELLTNLADSSELYIVTAKPTAIAKTLIEHHDLSHLFKQVLGYEESTARFEKSNLIKRIIHSSENAVMIGDRVQDIEAGKDAKIQTIGVLYGYGEQQEIESASPNYIAETVEDLAHLLG
ncbi:MAG: phosphoglycolate phosphatase [Crocinitomicaceae bacterium]|jgi:phosphoglycolate phosphatase